MDPEIVAAWITSIVAILVALLSALFSARTQRRVTLLDAKLRRQEQEDKEKTELERVMSRFKEPLGQAAYDLQSRLFNILERDLISAYVEYGDERSRSYVVNNTVYLIAQYFAWTEIIRREIQFIDLGETAKTRKLAHLRDEVYRLWRTDSFSSPLFRVFAGEARAIGERMVEEGPRGPESMGYAAFLDYLESEQRDPLLHALQSDVLQLRTGLSEARSRLVAIQHALIDLLAFLDPDFVRFTKDLRTKA